jgi:hypothetical protein
MGGQGGKKSSMTEKPRVEQAANPRVEQAANPPPCMDKSCPEQKRLMLVYLSLLDLLNHQEVLYQFTLTLSDRAAAQGVRAGISSTQEALKATRTRMQSHVTEHGC